MDLAAIEAERARLHAEYVKADRPASSARDPSHRAAQLRRGADHPLLHRSPREAPPQTVELLADLVFSVRLRDFEHAYAGTCGHVGGPPPPAAPKFRFASEPAVPL